MQAAGVLVLTGGLDDEAPVFLLAGVERNASVL